MKSKQAGRVWSGAALLLSLLGALVITGWVRAQPVAAHSVAAQGIVATPAPTEQAPTVPGSVEVNPIARDEEIATRLQSILDATDWFENPQVTVENGVVFLAGRTSQETYRTWAGELASKTRDVVAVVNRIAIDERSAWDVTPAFDEVQSLVQRAIRALPLLAMAIAVVILSWLARGLVVRLMRPVLARRVASPLLAEVGARLIAVPIVLLGIYLALQFLGLTRLALTVLGGTGIAGLVVGIGFRDIVENYLASILLSTDQPFRTGDTVQIGQRTGKVQALTTRATLLMGLDGNTILIPNATVYKSEIINLSTNPNTRIGFGVGISSTSSISRSQEAILAALRAHPAVLHDPEPLVLAERFNGASVDLIVNFWVDTSVHDGPKVKSALLRLTRLALRDAGVEIANPVHEVRFPAGLPSEGARPSRREREDAGKKAELPAAAETPAAVTPAEGQLTSEDEQLQKQADRSRTAGRENLLPE